jgi:hypothetical protein
MKSAFKTKIRHPIVGVPVPLWTAVVNLYYSSDYCYHDYNDFNDKNIKQYQALNIFKIENMNKNHRNNRRRKM